MGSLMMACGQISIGQATNPVVPTLPLSNGSQTTSIPTGALLPTTGITPTTITGSSTSTPAIIPNTAGTSGNNLETVIRTVAQEVRPAVVQITNEQVQPGQFNQPLRSQPE